MSSNGVYDATAEVIQAALAEIPDIDAFHVVENGNGVEEIHVVASASKSPKQLVRDIESLLLAKHKATVDRKKISIAQLSERVLPMTQRPLVSSVVAAQAGTELRIEVKLGSGGEEFVGTSTGPTSKSWVRRTVVVATLEAVKGLTKQALAFALEDVTIVTLSRERVALVALSAVSGGPEQIYCGTAHIRHDEKDAIVRATLDAVNRRISFLTTS